MFCMFGAPWPTENKRVVYMDSHPDVHPHVTQMGSKAHFHMEIRAREGGRITLRPSVWISILQGQDLIKENGTKEGEEKETSMHTHIPWIWSTWALPSFFTLPAAEALYATAAPIRPHATSTATIIPTTDGYVHTFNVRFECARMRGVCMRVCMRVKSCHTYTHTHMHAHAHTYTHTHILSHTHKYSIKFVGVYKDIKGYHRWRVFQVWPSRYRTSCRTVMRTSGSAKTRTWFICLCGCARRCRARRCRALESRAFLKYL